MFAMADSNETTAYGFKILFKRTKTKRDAAAGPELEADTPNLESNATLDFECYKSHITKKHDDKSPELTE